MVKRVTRDVDPDEARDLLERAPRACVCFASEEGPRAEPVEFAWEDGRYVVGIAEDAERLPDVGQEVVLLIDEGVRFFDLRALYIRGTVKSAEPRRGKAGGYGRTWLEVVPVKRVAWDYGKLREVRGEGGA